MQRSARLALAALVSAFALGCGPRAPVDARPDVLLITIDTLRADRLGSYGYGLETSPNVDALAAGGVLFERAIAAAPSTSPSHASIMTSRYTREHSVGYRTGPTRLEGTATLAELFREAGYRTAAFVGNVNLRRRSGFARGFDLYDDELEDVELNRREIHERGAQATTQRALRWLAARGPGPLFLWVHYQDPHGPYAPPPPYAGRFRLPPRPGERPLAHLDDDRGVGGVPRYQALPGVALPTDYEARYADEIAYADRWIGALLAAVDARAAGREAVVLLTADHGESFGEDGRYFVHGHATTPPLAHVPMILRAPGLSAGRRADPVHHVDVMPTLLELAGIAAPPGLRGLALGPFLREGRPLPERVVYCDNGAQLSAYGSEGFVRVTGIGGVWRAAAGRTPRGRWSRYAWQPGGGWFLVEAQAAPRPAIREYFGRAVPMSEGPPLDPATRERLRALGYGDVE